MNYNLQPYNGKGDSTGFRTKKWYAEQVFPQLMACAPSYNEPAENYEDKNDLESNKAYCDVGCGNGRLTKMIANNMYGQVYCIDPACNYDQKFNHHKIKYEKTGLMEWKVGRKRFDGLIFMGSMYIMLKNHGFRIIKRCKRLLKPGGFVFAVFASNNRVPIDFLDWCRYGFKIYMKLTKDQTSVIMIAERPR